MPQRPEASIIIPHFNDAERLFRCLSALLSCEDIARAEVIIVNNGPNVLPKGLAECFLNFRFLHEPEIGAAAARNCGVRHAKGYFLFFLDCDCIPSSDWISKALVAARSSPISGGRITLFDESDAPRTGAQAFETVFGFQQERYVQRKGFSVTANLITNRDVFETVGPFRASVSEDLDWCRRATDLGIDISYAADVIVRHPTRANWQELAGKWRRIICESYEMRPDKAIWLLSAFAMPLSCLWHLPRILRSSNLRNGAEKRRAALTLVRLRCWRMVEMIRLSLTARHWQQGSR